MVDTPPDRDCRDGDGPADIDLRHERGRRATAPQEIPPRGWKDMVLRVKDEARRDNLVLVGAGMAFFGLLALAPGLAAVVSIYGLVASPDDVARHLDSVSGALPAEAADLLDSQLQEVVAASGSSKGIGVLVGIALALWSTSAAMKQLLQALSSMYDEDEDRGFVALRARALALTAGAIVFLVATMVLLAVVPAWAQASDNGVLTTAASVARWPVLIALMMVALSVLYRFGPDRERPRWRWVSWGAAIATVVWVVASVGFSIYAGNIGNYAQTYGSMAVVVVTMVWLWITGMCILLGAEINAELERQTLRDSTTGPEQPRGQRDAYAADTVGAGAD
jgi:membrane protein